MECAGLSHTLFVVHGSCQGVDVALDSDYIPFGAVVQRSSITRKLLLMNRGDLGVRFRWDAKRFAPDFSISPTDGYISQGMEIMVEVTFHPQELNGDIRYEVSARPARSSLTRHNNLCLPLCNYVIGLEQSTCNVNEKLRYG